MRPNENKHWVVEQFEKNLFAILVGGAMIWSTFQTSDADTSRSLVEIEKRLAGIDEKLRDRRSFMGCAVRSLDKISEKSGITLPCDMPLPE